MKPRTHDWELDTEEPDETGKVKYGRKFPKYSNGVQRMLERT